MGKKLTANLVYIGRVPASSPELHRDPVSKFKTLGINLTKKVKNLYHENL